MLAFQQLNNAVVIPPPVISTRPAYQSSRDVNHIQVVEIPQAPPSLWEANFRGSAASIQSPRQKRSVGFAVPASRNSEKRLPSSYSRQRPSASSSAYRRRSSAGSHKSFASLQRGQARPQERVNPSLEKAGDYFNIQNLMTSDTSGSGDERGHKSAMAPTPSQQIRAFFGRKKTSSSRDSQGNKSHEQFHFQQPSSSSGARRRMLREILGRQRR